MSRSQSPASGTKRTLRSGARNPRRRQRQSDADSIKTAPRRKRSKINEDTFQPPRHSEEEVNGSIETAATNGDIHQHHDSRRSRARERKEEVNMMEVTEMPLRAKKASVKRPTRGDGATVLTQNTRYAMKLLPSTPRELRREGVEYRGSLGAGHYALAVTRERAYVWDYTSHTAVTNPRTFNLPFSVKASEALPFGALVAGGSTTDAGLVLVSATTGKIFFYESIERAASIGLFQHRSSAVEGSTPSLWMSETVTDIISASHAGVILTLSSGRIVHFTVRDAQGKSRISAEALRVEQEGSGGFFGSIKDYLGTGAFQKDVSALRTRSLDDRGRFQIIALTERAQLQVWDLEWNGRPTSTNAIDFKELLVNELKKEETPETQGRAETVSTLDFAIVTGVTTDDQIVTPGVEKPIVLLVLARVGPADNFAFVLAEMSIEGHAPACTRLMEVRRPLSLARGDGQKPRLLLPEPQHTALIFHENAVSIVSLETVQVDGPDAQLRGDSRDAMNFEDSVYLRKDRKFRFLGVNSDDPKSETAMSVAFVQSAGLMRLSVADPTRLPEISKIPARTMIEQAVFHGALQDDNILDFSRQGDSIYSPEEIEDAALSVSEDVLQSTSSFISTTPTSMESHLAYKAEALRALVSFVRQNFPTVSTRTMWQLLWDAEKVVAAQQLWQVFEKHVADVSQVKRTATAMDEICATLLRGLEQSGVDENQSDSEAARIFFIHHLNKLELLFPMAKDLVLNLREDQDIDSGNKMRIVKESCDLWTDGLEAIFRFRSEDASAYGIVPDFIQDGILNDPAEYAELPEFWTSTENLLKSVVRITNEARNFVADFFEDSGEEEIHPETMAMMQQCGTEVPRLIQLGCLIYQERINWLSSRTDAKQQQQSHKLQDHYVKNRHEQIRALANIAQSEAGLRIAEKYHDMNLLTVMIVAEMQFALEELPTATDDRRIAIVQYLEHMRSRIGKYFERFGDDWANAYFDAGFSNQAGLMLKDGHEAWQDALTRYLRAEPSRAKISWINDLIVDKDYARASKSLTLAGCELESRLWNRKVELSLAKLATLATVEELADNGQVPSENDLDLRICEDDLTIVTIQQQLYDHLYGELVGCIDKQAEVQEAARRFAWKNQDLHSLRQLLHSCLERIVSHEVLSVPELIDVFTLMDVIINPSADFNLDGAEFYLALKVLSAAATAASTGTASSTSSSFSLLSPHRVEGLLQLIWKRVYVYDDWIEIDSSSAASDEEKAVLLRGTVLWKSMYHAFESHFFPTPTQEPERHPNSSHPSVRFLLPSECLGAGCVPEDLAWRFASSSRRANGFAKGSSAAGMKAEDEAEVADGDEDDAMDLLDPITSDNRIHDEQLAGFINDRRLDSWSQMVVRDALNAVLDGRAEEAVEKERESEFEAVFATRGDGKYDGMGGFGGVNGLVNGGDEHIHAVGTGVLVGGEDEDVEMS